MPIDPAFCDRIKALHKVFEEIARVVQTIREAVMTVLHKFLRDESGATAIEYGLIAAGISVAIIAVVQGLGTKLVSTFTSVKDALK
jgi:pilus assembly protein Flp/PilA